MPSAAELRDAQIGGGDYLDVGREFLRYFVSLAGLTPTDSVLEVGCGMGRMAVPLAEWLSPRGSYVGLDIVPSSITWCREHIGSRHSNFRFHLLDIRNTSYNPGGTSDASAAVFPFPDESFDLVLAVSVFTHLLPASAVRYLLECRRVLKRDGRFFSTWFIVPDSESLTGPAAELLRFDLGDYRVASRENPEAVIGFKESFVNDAYHRAGLETTHLTRGHWAAGVHEPPYQDMLIAVRDR